MRSRAQDGELGSVSVVVAAILLVTMVVALGAADLARVLIAASRAQTAADAGALAAAQSLAFPGEVEPAAAAFDLVTRNGGRVRSCGCEPGTFEARIEVEMPVGRLFLSSDDLVVAARARAIVEVSEP
ncbi:MAG TPA: pilus assembly protein TadG-related protein [Actinomycetota bacterium]|nr:pilus assembly protein TadG-related protein [Actinomycetota bacterium]